VDAYTGQPIGTKDSPVRTADSRRIDAELRTLASNEAIRRGRMLDDPFAWEARRIRYRTAGSYAALERALESMRDRLPGYYSLLMTCVVHRSREPSEDAEASISAGVAWLAARMPGDIRVPRWVTLGPPRTPRTWPGGRAADLRARMQRDAQILEMRAEGVIASEIARAIGCSRSTVQRAASSGTAS